MNREALRAVVHGRVQGVGFRAYAHQRARTLGLDGYARNLADGTVEVYAEGSRRALEELRGDLELGPPAARVSRVDVDFGAARGAVRGFHVQ